MNKARIILICLIIILTCTAGFLLKDYSTENNETVINKKTEEESFWNNQEVIYLERLYAGEVDITGFEKLFEEICNSYFSEINNYNPSNSLQKSNQYFEDNKSRIYAKTGIANEQDFYELLKIANRVCNNKSAKKVTLNLKDYKIEDNYFKFSAILYDGNNNQYNFNISLIIKKNNNEPSIVIIPTEKERIYE